jgi:hypothetical protein
MWSITGRRPDGKPYSEVPFPRPLPECPDNGLVVFADFTPVERDELGKWIATPVYQSMRKSESPFYRAYWLATKIRKPEADAIEQLLPAIWEAKADDGYSSSRRRTVRYQRVLISAVEHLSPAVSLDDRVWLKGQAANALREMGQFDAAERMTESAEAELPHTTRPALAVYFQKLEAVIARHDRGDEPLDMIPDVQASLICRKKAPQSAFDKSYCSRSSIASIFKPANLDSPSEIARRAEMWQRITSAANTCHVKVSDKKLVNQDQSSLHVTYKLVPNTPEASRCMFQKLQDKTHQTPP